MNMQVKLSEFENLEAKAQAHQNLPRISVVGLGYVGAVSTACLAGLGHQIVGVDVDQKKAEQIARGESPIHEDRLGELLAKGVSENLITATTDLVSAIPQTEMTFVSVGTPTSEDGGCDMRYIISAAQKIGEGLKLKDEYHLVVMRCSIPPATTLDVMVPEIEKTSGKKMGEGFGVCFNPEFLREGTAVYDFDNPPKTVIGANDERAARMLADLYLPVDPNPITTSIEVAEMVKYVDNVWHATKVCFGNEVGRVCKPLGIDSHQVMEIFVQDTKLNLSPYYLKPGFAYGGSCLPKEVRAVQHLAEKLEVRTPLIRSLSCTNMLQIEEARQMIRNTGAKRIGFLGLAFKTGTDDLRESPILEVINSLIQEGYDITTYDSAIRPDTRVENQFDYVRNACPHLEPLVHALPASMASSIDEVAEASEVLVVTQKTPEIEKIVAANIETVQVIDLVRLFKNVPENDGYDGIGW